MAAAINVVGCIVTHPLQSRIDHLEGETNWRVSRERFNASYEIELGCITI